MQIDKVLTVCRVSPPLLVVECAEGQLFELSLKELKDVGYNLSDAVWKSLSRTIRFLTVGVRHAKSSKISLNPTSTLSRAISMAGPVQMKENRHSLS
jgi:hypothetical protein